MSFFKNLITTIMNGELKGRYFHSKDFGVLHKDIDKAVESVMSKSGEVSSLVYAEHLSELIENLGDNQFINFFDTLLEKYDIDSNSLSKATKEYSKNKTQKNLEAIARSSEPQWVELFRTKKDGLNQCLNRFKRAESKNANSGLSFSRDLILSLSLTNLLSLIHI